MSANSKIEWTDATWNPIRGCSRVSEGCRNCYAEKIAARFSGPGQAFEKVAKPAGWTGAIEFVESKLEEPLHWKKPRRIFVNSMSDLFHDGVLDRWLNWIFGVMARCPQHTFQILTKRPKRMLMWAQTIANYHERPAWVATWKKNITREDVCISLFPLPNVWLGVSVEDQATADERIPLLLQTPAAIRWVSYEPALGPVDFRHLHYDNICEIDSLEGTHGVFRPHNGKCERLDWVVCGGESGPGARWMNEGWPRSVRDQCALANVPFFFKQWGEWAPSSEGKYYPGPVPEFRVPVNGMLKIGKKKAGRLLDGREHNDFPVVEI